MCGLGRLWALCDRAKLVSMEHLSAALHVAGVHSSADLLTLLTWSCIQTRRGCGQRIHLMSSQAAQAVAYNLLLLRASPARKYGRTSHAHF